MTVPPPDEALANKPAIRRQTARVLPVDPEGRVLLLHGWDPHRPDEPFWFTVGGAVEKGAGEVGGESLREAAARELYEETRISVDPAQLGEPIAQNTIEFSWGGHRITQEQVFYAVLVESAEVSLDGLDQWEQATTDKYGWLAAEDLGADERPAHPDIPDLIRAAAASVRRE
jgi:8-oxo-dGTP pyrophosphatase MutT (NUDIX family)